MKFYVKQHFIYNNESKQAGDIIEVPAEYVEKLSKANVLGAPVKEVVIETAVIRPVENQMRVAIHPNETIINKSQQKELLKKVKK